MADMRQAYGVFWGNPKENGNFEEIIVLQGSKYTCKAT